MNNTDTKSIAFFKIGFSKGVHDMYVSGDLLMIHFTSGFKKGWGGHPLIKFITS